MRARISLAHLACSLMIRAPLMFEEESSAVLCHIFYSPSLYFGKELHAPAQELPMLIYATFFFFWRV